MTLLYLRFLRVQMAPQSVNLQMAKNGQSETLQLQVLVGKTKTNKNNFVSWDPFWRQRDQSQEKSGSMSLPGA